MAEFVDGTKISGLFEIDKDRKIAGELTLAGAETYLYLHDENFFSVGSDQNRDLRGILRDRTRVTLVDCTVTSDLGSASNRHDHYSFAEVFPHYVVTGGCHLDPKSKSIKKVIFRVDDAETIFYDFDAFGHVLDPNQLIDLVAKANEKTIGRKVNVGPNPKICYFAGQREIVSVETAIGKITVHHQPRTNMPGPRGVWIKNAIVQSIEFSEPLEFKAVLNRVLCLLRFLEVLAGRTQNLEAITLDVSTGDGKSEFLELYWCLKPSRSPDNHVRRPHPADLPLDAIRNRDQFENVLSRWIAVDERHAQARVRFSGGFAHQSNYSIDRLVGAANMFDVLPDEAFPHSIALPKDVAAAKQEARRAFKDLPDSEWRNSILGALGRLGSKTLRQKILYRANIVDDALENPLINLEDVIDEAVKCRNFFVHGAPGSFNYHDHNVLPFFVDTFEFLFAASELIDAGWDAKEWRKNGSVLSHPFKQTLESWKHYPAVIVDLRAHSGRKRQGRGRPTSSRK